MKFYLSGGMEYKKNLGKAWREWLTGELEQYRHDAIDPVKLEVTQDELDIDIPIQQHLISLKNENKLDEVRRLTRRLLFRKDIFAIQMADALIVYYDESVRRGAGTLSECWEAFREGVPIYLVTELPLSEVPTWLIAETTDIFTSFENLLDYVKDHSHIIRDQMEAQRVSEKTLGGIY